VLIGSWCLFTIGTIPPLDNACSVFVRVLYQRYQYGTLEGDLVAIKMLRDEHHRILKEDVSSQQMIKKAFLNVSII
jgi:hypothetical protein